jgi:hypothetical protein
MIGAVGEPSANRYEVAQYGSFFVSPTPKLSYDCHIAETGLASGIGD